MDKEWLTQEDTKGTKEAERCVRLANDNDTDTLIQDGSNMCWTSGPAGMGDGHDPSKKQRTCD